MRSVKSRHLVPAIALPLALLMPSGDLAEQDLPDLIITNDSRIRLDGSCNTNEPLWTGTIAIKNVGYGEASIALSAGGKPHLKIYVPDSIDMTDEKKLTRSLAPLDQKGVEVEIGQGLNKVCRFFSSPPTIGKHEIRYNVQTVNRVNRIRLIQEALIRNDYPLPKHGADGRYGSETRAAIRAYFRDKNEPVPGDIDRASLSNDTIELLTEKLGASRNTINSCVRGARIKEVTVYAVVDPFNVIEESNEANNSAKFTVKIDCSNAQ